MKITSAGGKAWGTAKRAMWMPLTYGDGKLHPHQQFISEWGLKAAYWWQLDLRNGSKIYLCAYRNGLGKVVLAQTTDIQFGPGKWVFEYDTPIGLEGDPKPLTQDPELAPYSSMFDNSAVLLTRHQRGWAWFVCRYGMVTSTSAASILSLSAVHLKHKVRAMRALSTPQLQSLKNTLTVIGLPHTPPTHQQRKARLEKLKRMQSETRFKLAEKYNITFPDSCSDNLQSEMLLKHELENGARPFERDFVKVF